MINIICRCGKKFKVFPSRISEHKGKFCSKKCTYKFRVRPSGLKYKIKKINSTWFKPGVSSWNKGKSGKYLKNYKGDKAKINTTHKWIRKWFGIPKICEKCGSKKNVEWSNKSEKYKRIRSDWQVLCKKCHHYYDYKKFNHRVNFYE